MQASVPDRSLVVVADDFGLGPATSEAILELGGRGKVAAAVLLVNSPHAADAVACWRRHGGPACVALGWHACLTLDRPILPPARLPSLVRADGSFHGLGAFLLRLFTRRVRRDEVRTELAAQQARFIALTGGPPALVNGHHHIQALPVVSRALAEVLTGRPYVRRVCETPGLLACVPGSRLKRLFLSTCGRRSAAVYGRAGFPGNDVLAGVGALPDLSRLERWLRRCPGSVVELMVHPGRDEDEARRDTGMSPGERERQFRLLDAWDLDGFCRDAGLAGGSRCIASASA
jgi:hypothetical protein